MLKVTLLAAAMLSFPILAQAQNSDKKTEQGTGSYVNKGLKEGSGKTTDPANTAASRDLPVGSTAKVTNEKTGKSTDVEITGKGPMRQDRVIDTSKKAAQDLGMEKSGTAPVKVEPK